MKEMDQTSWKEKTLAWAKKEKAQIQEEGENRVKIMHGRWYLYTPARDLPKVLEIHYEGSSGSLVINLYNPYFKGNALTAWKQTIEDYLGYLQPTMRDELLENLYSEEDFIKNENHHLTNSVFYLVFGLMFIVVGYVINSLQINMLYLFIIDVSLLTIMGVLLKQSYNEYGLFKKFRSKRTSR